MSRHSGGSLSFDHHQLRMEKEKCGPIPEVDVYRETHTKTLKASEKAACAPTEYTTMWSGMVLEKYLELATERFGSERDTHPKRIDRELWEQASGCMKKGTLFGISNEKRALTTSWAAGLSGPNMGETSNEVQSLKQKLEEQEKKAEEFKKEAQKLRKESEERATQMTQLQEQERETCLEVKEMHGQLAKLTKILNEKFSPSA